MNIMSIIDNIYESKNFTVILWVISILVLSAVFLIILILGLKMLKRIRDTS